MKLRDFVAKTASVYQLPVDNASVATYVTALRLAGFNETIPKSLTSNALDILLKTKTSPSLRTASTHTAKTRCPRCHQTIQVVKLGNDTDAEFCPGCLMTRPIG